MYCPHVANPMRDDDEDCPCLDGYDDAVADEIEDGD